MGPVARPGRGLLWPVAAVGPGVAAGIALTSAAVPVTGHRPGWSRGAPMPVPSRRRTGRICQPGWAAPGRDPRLVSGGQTTGTTVAALLDTITDDGQPDLPSGGHAGLPGGGQL